MDLDEWEVIPSTKPYLHVSSKELLSFLGPDVLVETDYFRCPTPGLSPSPSEHQQQEEEEKEVEEQEAEEEEEEEEMPKEFKDIGISTEFRKEERSPAPTPAPTSPVNWLEPDPMVFSHGTIMTEKEEVMQMERKKEVVVEEEKDCTGFNLWGLSVHGIGAICSFGVATAATLCVFALSTASASSNVRVRSSPNIQFQIFSDDKRIKDVVQRATGLNHAISAARGITIPTAQISFGGHYEGL
ncbi:hypothetical protein LUZ61_016383 [Rhynchospora tenuis]|uniref:DUF6821 domain-containing protein n=1 Tax=Rhynchospora tenuis TaxID=198213 RepID=A0AAD5Z5E8_9POAL|nr:hypothetical protein LUZ61_016383 [Rhynchospora tenuis]